MAIAGLVSCSDDFDAPPVKVPTATIKANTTIADFKAEYWKTETPYCVPVNVPEGESKVISGRVISSDATGNIYKSLVIQDETAALAISINANSLYTTYRVGQEVVIDLNGMYVGKYANLLQLGYPNEGTRGTEAGFMALELFESHAQLNGLPDVSKIDTIPVSISELPTTPTEICMMQSQLVRLDNVQWVEAGQRYSEESASTSRNLKDASGNTIIVRNSNYATFRTELLPEGEGTVIGILSYYNNAWQILLRSAEDVIGFKTPEGVMANPYTIERAKELQGQDITGWVAGYIVGAVAPGVNEVKANTDIQWGIEAAMDNSLVIGATADTKDIANCVIVPLPQDTKLRELGNIRDHKDLVGKAIKVKGVLENQYAQAGVNCSGALGTFEIEGVETGGDGTPSGDGSLANPFNCAGANEYTSGLAADTESPNNVYIKGKVVSIKEEFGSYGNASFYISDDGTANNQFYVFRCLYLGNKKWTSGDTQIKVGDEVVICGKVVNYKGNTPETVTNKAYIYSLNGNGGSTGGGETGGGTASGNGTIDNPYNAAGVTAYINTLADNEESPNDVYIKGKIASVKEEFGSFGNATFYISDDGTSTGQFYVYRTLYLGNQKWTDGNTQIKAGDEVIICGKVVKYVSSYGTTPETVQNKAYIYSLNGKTGDGGSTGGGETGGGETGGGETGGGETGGGDVQPSGNNLLGNGDFEIWNGSEPTNWKSACTASSATLTQSTDAHGGNYSVSVGFYETQNKRLAYKEITLKPGSYTFSFYAKSTTTATSQCRPGYTPVKDGSAGSYSYGDYASLNNSEWTLVTYSFTLSETTTICPVVMNPKTSSYATAQAILIDDASLTTTDGGFAE